MKKKLLSILALSALGAGIVGANLCDFDINNVVKQNVPVQVMQPHKESPMNVHFMDVGKADSILITCNEKNILIDAADKDVNNKVVQYLKRENVKNLDLIIVTHPHRDHIGQMPQVIKDFSIQRFLAPSVKDSLISNNKTYQKVVQNLKEKGITSQEPIAGENFDVDQMHAEILAPNKDYDNINNYSIVTRITYGNKAFLFTGDAEKESENDILKAGFDVKSDVLKVGHHGSKTSTGPNFLSKVNPRYAVICVGDDRNNLPKKETLNRLEKNNVEVLRTDLNGNIVFSTNGEELKIFKEKN